jgi:hypothetical protein
MPEVEPVTTAFLPLSIWNTSGIEIVTQRAPTGGEPVEGGYCIVALQHQFGTGLIFCAPTGPATIHLATPI